MKLPHGERAIVEDAKLLEYVLNPEHPVGRHHAVLFDRLLGITQQNAAVLRDALIRTAATCEVVPGRPSLFGRKFEMHASIRGPRGDYAVRAVWLIETGGDRPRLITCYVE